jgi:TRAP-type C4-dicarboxylate transport system permease small subunit
MKNIFVLIDRWIEKVSWFLLIFFLVGMILLSAFTILARLFSLTLVWIDPVVRHFVFYSAFCGGIIAVSRGTHIKIDLMPIFLKSQDQNNSKIIAIQLYLNRFLSFFSGVTLLYLTDSAYKFLLLEKEFGKEAFLGIQSSELVSGIMIGFLFLAYRFFIRAFINIDNLNHQENSLVGNN